MERITHAATGSDDAELVLAGCSGDRDALAAIYDRYADRVHTMCWHMLRDRDEAADVCGEVFLTAFSRLEQLRDPSRLRSWLFAIARHEVYRRTRRRQRVDLVEEVDEMDGTATASTEQVDEDATDPAALAAVVRDAAGGLDDRDRMVLELHLQGLGGDELAAALGTSTSTAYQRTHRMRERLERSIGAVLVARQGRAECGDLDRLLSDWDGSFSVLWRKRVARHVDGCEVCDRRRTAVPAMLLGGGAVAATIAGASPVSAAPASVRERVLDAAAAAGSDASSARRRWRRDGFPPADRLAGRRVVIVGIVGAVVAAAVLMTVMAGSDQQVEVMADAAPGTTATTLPSTTRSSPSPSPANDPPDPTPPGMDEPPPVELPPVELAPVEPPPVTGGMNVPPPGPPPMRVDDPPAPGPVPPEPTPPVAPPEPAPAPTPPLRVAWVGAPPSTVFHPTPGVANCGASTAFVVAAPAASSVQLWWTGADSSGVVELTANDGTWSGVLEVPPSVTGPLSVIAVGFGPDANGGTPSTTAGVAPCPTPG